MGSFRQGLGQSFLNKVPFSSLCSDCFLSVGPQIRLSPQIACDPSQLAFTPSGPLDLGRRSLGVQVWVSWEPLWKRVFSICSSFICLSSLFPTRLGLPHHGLVALGEVDEEWVRTNPVESLGCKERVCGPASDLCFPYWLLLLHLGALSCLVWLGQVRGWGPGGSGPRAQSPAGPHLAQTRWSGTAQSPAVRLNGLLVLSRKLSPARLQEVGREGGEPAWPRALAGLAGSSLLPSLSQTLTLAWPYT